MRVFMSGHWGILLRTIIAACLFVSVRKTNKPSVFLYRNVLDS